LHRRENVQLKQLPGRDCYPETRVTGLLDVQNGAELLARYFAASVSLMEVMARACGHARLSDLNDADITTWKREIADLSGIRRAGVMP
jgi:hypothetical protein